MAKAQISFEKTRTGIPVVTNRNEDVQSAGYMVSVKTGSRDETPDIWGISHLLEHMVFRATKSRTSVQMSKEVDAAGGSMNAFTAKECTAFYCVSLKDTASTAKSVVADMVCNPLLAQSDLDIERNVVLQEISMVENDPSTYIYDLFDETMWKDHPLAHGEAGSTERVEAFTSEDLRKYYSERYVRPNLCVIACGNVDKDDVMAWAEENFDGMPDGKVNERHAPKEREGVYRHVHGNGDHCYVTLGFPAFEATDPRRPALTALNAILGEGMSSRMFQKVREEKGLVYSIGNYTELKSDCGMMATTFSSTGKNVLEAVETAGKVLRDLRNEGITQEELDRARNYYKGRTVRATESTSKMLYYECMGTLLMGRPTSLDEKLAEIDVVTVDQVMAVAQDLIRDGSMTVVTHGKDPAKMKDFSPSQIEL